MHKLGNLLIMLWSRAATADYIFKQRTNILIRRLFGRARPRPVYRSLLGPYTLVLLLISILIVFSPVFLLEWATKRFDLPTELHDMLYLGYIFVVFGFVFFLIFQQLGKAIKKRRAVKNFARRRAQRKRRVFGRR